MTKFINDFKKLDETFYRYTIITLISGIILYIYIAIIENERIEYMTYSYSIITSACFCLSYGLRNKKHKITILAITGFLCIIFGGARGALLGIIAYIILKVIEILKKSLVKSLIFSAVSSILFLLIYFNFKNIILFLINIGDKLGIQTRTLNYILTEDLISDQGRIIMYETVWSQIKESPIIGNGLFSDRYFINKYTSYGYVYTHNIALEILCHFGIIIGGIILLVLLYKLISKIFSKSDDVYYYEILYAIIPCGLIQLLFSGSYLSNITFYMLIGLLFKKKNTSNGDVFEEKKIG
jgi:O-antigen ligase